MTRSESIGDLISALAKAQAEFGKAVKEKEGKIQGTSKSGNAYEYSYNYADLAANIDAVRPALNKHGIALLQFPEVDLELQTVSVTTSLHCGEQWIAQTFVAPAVGRQGFNVQSIGAATTYLRRYGLQALCGLASEDDDGNSVATENKPIAKAQLSQDEDAAHLKLIAEAKSLVELKNFWQAAVMAARKAKDADAEKRFNDAKEIAKLNMSVATMNAVLQETVNASR